MARRRVFKAKVECPGVSTVNILAPGTVIGQVVTFDRTALGSDVSVLLKGNIIGHLDTVIGPQMAAAITRGQLFTAVILRAYFQQLDPDKGFGADNLTTWVDLKVEYLLEKDHMAVELPKESESVSASRAPKSFFTKVAGVTFDNDDGSCRQRVIARCSVGENLTLVPDPGNRFDSSAVKVVRSNGEQLGFLPEHITRGRHSSGISWQMDRGDVLQCRLSSITGGGPGESLGVNIEITGSADTPETCMLPSQLESSPKERSTMDGTNLQLDFDGQDIAISPTVSYGARGAATWECKVFHNGLNKHTVIKAGSTDLLAKKVKAQANQWNSDWQREIAHKRTIEAQKLLEPLRSILTSGIGLDPSLDWEACKVKTPFAVIAPAMAAFPAEPTPGKAAAAPEPDEYQADLSLLDRIVPSRKARKIAEAEKRLLDDVNAWEIACANASEQHVSALSAYRSTVDRLMQEHKQVVGKWEEERTAYNEEQARQHSAVDELRKQYEAKSPDAVVEYCNRVLSLSSYPSCIPREFEFDFNPETGILLVGCKLPPPDDLPKVCEVRYVQATDTLEEKFLSEAERDRMYDEVVYHSPYAQDLIRQPWRERVDRLGTLRILR
jgi:hypothetical protein